MASSCSYLLDLLLLSYFLLFQSSAVDDRTKSYCQTFKEHTGYLSDKWSYYLYFYEQYLHNYRASPINYLEVGVQNGGSLQIAKKYFHDDSNIYGIDIDRKVCELLTFEKGITAFCFDAANADHVIEFVKSDFMRGVSFDVVIDDGSHIQADMIKTFTLFFQLLRPGGVYIVEDTVCSYWSEYGGGLLKEDTAVEYFKKLADIFHLHFMQPEDVNVIHERFYPFIPHDLFMYYHQWLESVMFTESMVIIKKRTKFRKENEGMKRVVSGNVPRVFTSLSEETIKESRKNLQNLDDKIQL